MRHYVLRDFDCGTLVMVVWFYAPLDHLLWCWWARLLASLLRDVPQQ